MLAEGTITPEQANQFLELLGTAREQPRHAEHGPREAPPDWQSHTPHRGHRAREQFRGPDIERMIQMRSHGVDARLRQELADAGYPGLAVDQLIEAGMHGVHAGFVREMQSIGLQGLPFEKLVEMRMHGVSPSVHERDARGGLPRSLAG